MGIVDTLFVGQLGAEAIGAGSVGSALYFSITSFGIGLLLGLDTLVWCLRHVVILLVERFQLGKTYRWCPSPACAAVRRHRLTHVLHDLIGQFSDLGILRRRW